MAEQEVENNLIPVRRWIREYYTKLTRSNKITCNHCNDIYIIYVRRLDTLST